MNKVRVLASRATLQSAFGTTIGLSLAALWGMHAAAPSIPPGRGYIRFGFLFAVAVGWIVWRESVPTFKALRGSTKNGIVFGMACWLAGATLSTVLNWHTNEVVSTYFVVFVTGAVLYWALAGVKLSQPELETAIIGLVIGSMFPLISGLMAFGTEFGTPDATTFVTAYIDRVRMASYESVTFGNRGNTAAFLLILAPILLAVAADSMRSWMIRVFCGVALVPVVLNFLIVEVRAAFLALLASIVVIWWFKRGARRVPLLAGVLVFSWLVLFNFEPEVVLSVRERIMAAATIDRESDNSVQERVEAMNEGLSIFGRNWLLGIGPGGAPTVHSHDSAHQLQINQAMETGVLGFLGSTVFAIGIWICLARTMVRGRGDAMNDIRFTLLIGPASYVTYAVTVNAALTNSSVNTWAVLVVSMLALMPPFENRPAAPRIV